MGEVREFRRSGNHDALLARNQRTPATPAMAVALGAVVQERTRQLNKWGKQDHVDPHEWLAILTEEVGEVAKPVADARLDKFRADEYRAELVQVAAVAVAAIEALDAQREEGKYESPS